MSSADKVARVFEDLRTAFRQDRLGHAYLLVGDAKGDALDVADRLLQLVLCTGKEPPCGRCADCLKVARHRHEDVTRIEPQSKSRMIRMDEIRALNHRIATTSFGGGWKAAVLMHAERMTDDAANAFLKTLEEPPPRSLLLMLSAAPEHLPATIVSRCQRVLVSGSQPVGGGEWSGPLLEMLRGTAQASVLSVFGDAAFIDSLLKAVKTRLQTEAEEEEGGEAEVDSKVIEARVEARVREVRADMLRTILAWHRDVLMHAHGVDPSLLQFPDEAEITRAQAELAGPRGAMARLGAVEDAIRMLDRNLPPRAAFEAAGIEQARALARARRAD